MTITRALLKQVRVDLDAALKAVAEKHGLASLKAGNIKFTDRDFTVKVEGLAKGAEDRAALNYRFMVSALGLPPLNSKFEFRREQYEIVGLSPTGAKVMLTRLTDGKTGFKMSADWVVSTFKANPTAFVS